MPAGILVAGCVDLAISLVILMAIVLIWGLTPSLAILPLLLLIVIAAAAALGTSTALLAINSMVGVVEGFRWATLGPGNAWWNR